MDPLSVSAKFEVRGFTRLWDSREESMVAIEIWGGVRTPILGKGRPYGVGDGTVRKSVGEFL